MSKLKVLQVNKYYYPWIGGIETIVRQISEGISRDTDVKVLVCKSPDIPLDERKITNAEEINGVYVEKAGSLGEIAKVPLSYKFIYDFRKLAKDADIVHIHVPFPLGDLACLLSGYKGKVVIWWHSDVVRQKRAMLLYRPIMEALLKRADIIMVSADGVAKGSQYLGPYLDKCKTIHFGLDKHKYNIATKFLERSKKLEKSSCTKSNIKFLFMGRLVYYKGCSILIDAMAKIKGDVHLTIIGSGPLREELQERCERLGISDKVCFAGRVKDEELAQYYEDADVFVLPSTERSEAFALVQLEAMAYGIPVINTNLKSGVPEVSLNGETGLTVEPEDVDGLARAMQWMIDNPAERLVMGKKARERLEREFTEEKMISEVLETYNNLIDSGEK